ncbi:spore coat associated protein CotJA [Roseburia sp. 831b]|uniref:spore coat associated protein CotJA n=1 Tax=Roseburia sp. 831b TaxID=1261635 RepID=UPI000951FF82|nr:spore coat associated protein CotJA [Roseburia sp.]WVK73757.1 spore coat associated protein CotJA [Roseburia sp. 831b]
MRNCMMQDSMETSCRENSRENVSGKSVAMAYVPWQYFQNVYEPEKALEVGTIFPELDKPFLGTDQVFRSRRGMMH